MSVSTINWRAVRTFHAAGIIRWLTNGFFIFLFASSAMDKWMHFPQFVNAVGGYVLVPVGYAQTIAVFTALFELWLAIGLAFPVWRTVAAPLATTMLLVFGFALFINHHFGVLTPCGCWFSITLSEATRPHIVLDFLLAGLAATLWSDTRHDAPR